MTYSFLNMVKYKLQAATICRNFFIKIKEETRSMPLYIPTFLYAFSNGIIFKDSQ